MTDKSDTTHPVDKGKTHASSADLLNQSSGSGHSKQSSTKGNSKRQSKSQDSLEGDQKRNGISTSTEAGAAAPTNAAPGPGGLDELDNEGRSLPIPIPQKPKKKIIQVQTQLDIGGMANIQCRKCGMHYNKTTPNEIATHEKFHNEMVQGPAMPAKKSLKVILWQEDINGVTNAILAIDRHSPKAMKDKGVDALNYTLDDLPGVLPNAEQLFATGDSPEVPEYKIYVYTKADRPVCVLLAEKISSASEFRIEQRKEDEFDEWPQMVPDVEESIDEKSTHPARLGICRIWTCIGERRQQLATSLVDKARGDLIRGMRIAKNQVAFTWTTTMGKDFAIAYSRGKFDFAFLAYVEHFYRMAE